MITRFAPSPTGPLHLGHAYSALLAYGMAIAAGGTFLLRIEDIDRTRARDTWETQIYDDLGWLGLTWPAPVMRQSERMSAYSIALDALWAKGFLYVCDCSRRDVQNAMSAPQEGVTQIGPDGLIYPGTCREKNQPTVRPKDATLRLRTEAAVTVRTLSYTESYATKEHRKIEIKPSDLVKNVGDIVVARKDMGTSYHLSVVLDDANQEITDVVRGNDLAEATQIHVLLQSLLDLPTPAYHHHDLIRDETGKRLAKRDDARALAKYCAEGATPNDIRRMVGLPDA